MVQYLYRKLTAIDSSGDLPKGWPEKVNKSHRVVEFIAIVIVCAVAGNLIASLLSKSSDLMLEDMVVYLGSVCLICGAYILYQTASLIGSARGVLDTDKTEYASFLNDKERKIKKSLRLSMVALGGGTVLIHIPSVPRLYDLACRLFIYLIVNLAAAHSEISRVQMSSASDFLWS